MLSVEDKNRCRVDVCSEWEKERDRKLSPLPSLLPTLSSLLLSLPPLFCRSNRRTFTRQRSAFRCAAIIAYCERKLSLGQSFRTAVGRRAGRTINTEVWRESGGDYLTRTQVVWQITMRSRAVTQRDLSYFISPIGCQIFSKAFVQRPDVAQICATHRVAD